MTAAVSFSATRRRRRAKDRAGEWIAGYPAAAGDMLRDAIGGADEPLWRTMLEAIAGLAQDDLADLQARVARQVRELGTAYRLPGEEEERAWPLSPLPLVLGQDEWRGIEAGVAQRAELHERLLADIYGPQRLCAEGLLPAAAIAGSANFLRGMIDVAPPGGHRLHIYAADLARGPGGEWRVLGDHVRLTTGAGYALENRLAGGRVAGDMLHKLNVERLAPFFADFRAGIAAACKRTDPRIALLTPGRWNQSYAEQAHLARHMGLLLVEGDDLAVRDERLFVRTIDGLKRVDAVWRRIDSRFLDPLAFDSGSTIGVPGIMDAMAAGACVVANMPGSGVVESRAIGAFLPRLSRRLLNSGLLLPNIATWWCGQPGERAQVEASLDTLLIAPAFAAAAALADGRPVLGAGLAGPARRALLDDLARRPQDYVGQEVVRLSTMPMVRDGAIRPRPFTLRVFAARDGAGAWTVMPGGFARIGEEADVRAAVMGEGSASADVCVAAAAPAEPGAVETRAVDVRIRRNPGTLQSRAADNLFWLGRYLERGEAVLRIVRAMLGGTSGAESGGRAGAATAQKLIDRLIESGAATRKAKSGRSALPAIVRAALDDPGESGSVRAIFARSRTIGEGTRDRLSADVWRLLDLRLPAAPGGDPAALLLHATQLQERFSAIAGLAAENMVRTSGWHFHDLGRRLERAATVCRLVRDFAGDRASPDDLATLLDVQDSQISYRARYPEGVALVAVRDLVALDALNPRSLAHQIECIQGHLRALPSLRDDGMPEEQVEHAAWLGAAIATSRAESFGAGAAADFETRLYRLGEAIGARYFLQGGGPRRSANMMRLA